MWICGVSRCWLAGSVFGGEPDAQGWQLLAGAVAIAAVGVVGRRVGHGEIDAAVAGRIFGVCCAHLDFGVIARVAAADWRATS